MLLKYHACIYGLIKDSEQQANAKKKVHVPVCAYMYVGVYTSILVRFLYIKSWGTPDKLPAEESEVIELKTVPSRHLWSVVCHGWLSTMQHKIRSHILGKDGVDFDWVIIRD